MPQNVELARHQWEDGYRRLQALAAEPAREAQALGQVEVLGEQLRRRVGSAFTLAELVESYQTAEHWAYETLADRAERPGWTATVSLAVDSAFHLYARGARDYEP